MAKAGMFAKSEHEELNRITSKSILEKLMNIRQKINVEFTARRLVWELIQNAKDNVSLCNENNEKVDVNISLTEDEFIFSHNKGYFTSGHIRGLVRKYSSGDKERDTEQLGKEYKTTGRFGTGFMTTHLLSESVKIVSSFQQEESELFHTCSFWLDRTGKTEIKIVEGMNKAFDQAEDSILKSDGVERSDIDLQTSFIYPLTDQTRKLAQVALEEVHKGIAYTLINVPAINSLTVNDGLSSKTVYQVKIYKTLTAKENDIVIYNLLIDQTESKQYFLALLENHVQIIIPVFYDGLDYFVQSLNEDVPRIHLDFPMIGTEDLNLPFIVNSTLFEPTEPRDGVSLIDDEDNEFAQLNCSLMLKAVELYTRFLSFVGENNEWHDLYNLARISFPAKRAWIDSSWFNNNVIEPIRTRLLHTPLVNVFTGERKAILNDFEESQVFFPYADKETFRKNIWSLAKRLYPSSVPVENQVDKWYEVVWSDCYFLTISSLSEDIHKSENIENLSKLLEADENAAIDFLRGYYVLLNIEAVHINDILADKFAVIPNQLGEFRIKSDLNVDKGIDEELKNACALISVNPKSYLVYQGVGTGDDIRYPPKQQDAIITEINTIIKDSSNDNISSVCDYLASLFPLENIPEYRQAIFDFSARVYPDDFQHKRVLKNYDKKIWDESDKKSLYYIVSKISAEKTLSSLQENLGFENKQETLNWLHNFVSFLVKNKFENNINREKNPILPNQNGTFCTKDDLFLDAGDIDEIIKDIAADLGYDFREELLDSAIFLVLPENRTYNIADVAEKITTCLKPMLRDVDKRKEHKDTLKNFYVWMNDNRERAAKHFPDLHEKRFLFLEDDDISLNIKKAVEIDELMQEHGIESIEDLRNQLGRLKEINSEAPFNSEVPEKVNLTPEILASLGITSQTEFEEAFKDPWLQARFYHTSNPTSSSYAYAQTLIERAKTRIEAFLRTHRDYDCTNLEETAKTVLSGIVKNGVMIDIVTRPSDNGEVIFYYSSEKDTLDTDTAELWVDNGISDPHILTLGRILKSTGINRIPIRMN
ncbi:sacsin N-terminal ATP-binding-like domain-containing protein [Pedobacter sp.]|uniref:sacsin N-terminal ATP-binding-like domain-containing protein n=1 Tax=Pedobacter sp. TaxID=1411316 RepID=UPI003D7FF955